MRVLLVSHRYPPDGVAGVEQYTQALATELARVGDAVSVVTRRPMPTMREPRLLREQLPDGISIHRFVGGDALLNRFLDHHERLEKLFENVLISASPEVVHFNHLKDLSARFVELAHRYGAAVVLSLHDFYIACPRVHLQRPSGALCEGPSAGMDCAQICFAGEGEVADLRWGMRTTYFRRLLAQAERIIAYSRYVATYFRRFGAGSASIEVIPNGVPFETADSARWMRNSFNLQRTLNLAFVGTVTPHKGVHVILDALRIAGLHSVELTVFGQIADRDYVHRLRERAATISGLRLRFYGAYSRAELPWLLHNVDYVVLPSQVPEAGPIAPREALALGIPVIATRLGALPEVVSDGVNGFTFDPDRPGQLAAILQRVAGDEELHLRLGKGATKTPILTTSEHTRAVRATYEQALEDFSNNPVPRKGDTDELAFLHNALAHLFDNPR